jgi:hypothetical protein
MDTMEVQWRLCGLQVHTLPLSNVRGNVEETTQIVESIPHRSRRRRSASQRRAVLSSHQLVFFDRPNRPAWFVSNLRQPPLRPKSAPNAARMRPYSKMETMGPLYKPARHGCRGSKWTSARLRRVGHEGGSRRITSQQRFATVSQRRPGQAPGSLLRRCLGSRAFYVQDVLPLWLP